MNKELITISVIIPAYNAGSYLQSAIESILNQTTQPDEIIIVDDGSVDNTREIANAFRSEGIKLISQSHAGISASRNAGIRQASGKYLSFLDADDLWTHDKLAKQLEIFEQDATVHGVFGHVQQFISIELSNEEKKHYSFSPLPMPGYHAGTLLIERMAFLKAGMFFEEIQGGEFIEWYLRAKKNGLFFKMLGDTVMMRRIHGGNTVLKDKDKINQEYLKIVRMYLKNGKSSPHLAKDN